MRAAGAYGRAESPVRADRPGGDHARRSRQRAVSLAAISGSCMGCGGLSLARAEATVEKARARRSSPALFARLASAKACSRKALIFISGLARRAAASTA